MIIENYQNTSLIRIYVYMHMHLNKDHHHHHHHRCYNLSQREN